MMEDGWPVDGEPISTYILAGKVCLQAATGATILCCALNFDG